MDGLFDVNSVILCQDIAVRCLLRCRGGPKIYCERVWGLLIGSDSQVGLPNKCNCYSGGPSPGYD